MPLFISMLAASACADDPFVTTPDGDAGATEDGGASDDAARPDVDPADGRYDAPGREDTRGVDAPPRTDGTFDATGDDGLPTVDATRGDATGRGDAPPEAGDPPRTPDAAPDGSHPSCVGAVDPEFLREKLSKLSGELPVVIGGMEVTIVERYTAANRARARQFLTDEYQALGFTVTEHAYASGANLVATKPGADGKFLVLSGHYDTVRESVPGADDDGTGIIGALATARALQGCQLDHGLRVVAFDQEETGALGSKAYVSQLQSSGEIDDLIGDVQFEMAGYHTKPDGGFLLVDCRSSEGDRPESKFLNDAVLAAIARGNLALEPHEACVGSSDHGTFWTAGKPAVVFSEEFSFSGANANPCYHKECDTVSFINFDYYAKITTMSVLVTADLVGAR
jgi:hypothetical protein